MRLSDFNYNLPRELIAQEPIKPRDHSRLLILDKQSGKIEHKKFYNIIDYLKKGDVLVMNNSKVFPARLIGKRKESGGKVEVFLLRSLSPRPPLLDKRGGEKKCEEVWQCLVGGRRVRAGLQIEFDKNLEGELKKDNKDSTWEIEFNLSNKEMMKVVEKIGQTPLPPYIKRIKNEELYNAPGVKINNNDKNNYQTVYADEKKIGSVAAPTAGFHFTPELLRKIKAKGVQIEYITLHVGLGTFAPVKTDDISKHKMHAEFVEIDKDVLKRIIKAKKEKQRIIAVGTTSVRTLEAVFRKITNYKLQIIKCPLGTNKFQIANSKNQTFQEFVNIFIYPGYKFKIVDAMITNFHLPKSTLLMLVSAMACKDNIDKAYKEAIKKKYRFYSYGDAMFIS
ncbi:tRNA preQ1(34) S-adenosylmethionine ribosyltransferase-isomerase QueA [Candidatus Parcubacteria bacterium]|nr:tRNA preQ1(34) S-adenosylmethionine ribosyltransferase-isomerase QueA [Candidatus Parcubacteria bacterium]